MIAHPREARVHVPTAELFRAYFLSGSRADQRGSRKKNRSLIANDDVLVAHRRYVRAAGGARAHHDRDLRQSHRGHPRLVEEDSSEMISIGKDLRLERKERAPGI